MRDHISIQALMHVPHVQNGTHNVKPVQLQGVQHVIQGIMCQEQDVLHRAQSSVSIVAHVLMIIVLVVQTVIRLVMQI